MASDRAKCLALGAIIADGIATLADELKRAEKIMLPYITITNLGLETVRLAYWHCDASLDDTHDLLKKLLEALEKQDLAEAKRLASALRETFMKEIEKIGLE